MLSLHTFDDAHRIIVFLRIIGTRFLPRKRRENKSIQCPHCSQFMPERWEALYTLNETNDPAWALDVIDGLLDYFIVAPEKNRQRKAAWEKNRGPQSPPPKKP